MAHRTPTPRGRRLLTKFHQDRQSTVTDCRNLLIEHLDDKPVAYAYHGGEGRFGRHPRRMMIKNLLVDRKMLEEIGSDQHTIITDLGREYIAELLADWADALVEIALRREERDYWYQQAKLQTLVYEARKVPEAEELREVTELEVPQGSLNP